MMMVLTPRFVPGRAIRAGLLGMALLAAAGCSFVPRYQRPAAPVADRFPDAAATAADSGPRAADLAWQTFFADARLRRLIELGLQNNRDLRVAALNIERARAQYRIQRADELPTVNARGIADAQKVPGGLTPTGTGYRITSYRADLAVTAWEADFFGRIRALSDAALAQYLSTEEARRATQVSLVAGIASGYLTLLADDELLALTRRTVETREASHRLSVQRFEGGVATELDMRQTQTLLEAARATLAQFVRQRALDENALVLLLGQGLPADLPPAQPMTAVLQQADVPAGLPSDLLTGRPDIRSAEQQLISANANIGAARAQFFPRVSLTSALGSASGDLAGLFKGNTLVWAFTPSVTLPIFDAGRNQANLQVSSVNRDIAIAQYEKSIQTAFREVADALAGRSTLLDQLKALQAQAQAETARTRLSQLRYEGGVASFLDVLDAQRSLFAVQQTVIQVQLQQLVNQVGLYKALGGGQGEAAAR